MQHSSETKSFSINAKWQMQQMQLMVFSKSHLINSWNCDFPENIFNKTHGNIGHFEKVAVCQQHNV